MTDRGERRSQKERNKQRWRRKILDTWYDARSDQSWLDRMVNKLAGHGKLCSCYACGNPRRHFDEKTMQEKRADQPTEEHSNDR